MKNSKDNKNIELIDRDHYLNETDDIKINKNIREFMLQRNIDLDIDIYIFNFYIFIIQTSKSILVP